MTLWEKWVNMVKSWCWDMNLSVSDDYVLNGRCCHPSDYKGSPVSGYLKKGSFLRETWQLPSFWCCIFALLPSVNGVVEITCLLTAFLPCWKWLNHLGTVSLAGLEVLPSWQELCWHSLHSICMRFCRLCSSSVLGIQTQHCYSRTPKPMAIANM